MVQGFGYAWRVAINAFSFALIVILLDSNQANDIRTIAAIVGLLYCAMRWNFIAQGSIFVEFKRELDAVRAAQAGSRLDADGEAATRQLSAWQSKAFIDTLFVLLIAGYCTFKIFSR